MSKLSLKLGVVIALVLLLGSAASAEVIDRIIATVNGVPLMQSDLEDSVRVQAFLQQRPPESFTAADRDAALARMVDQELLRQQMQGEFAVNDADLDVQLRKIREQCNTAGNDGAWRTLLARYGLDQALLRDHLRAQLTAMRFVELRLRPTVRVDRDAVEIYYRETLVPKLQQAGAKADPLSAVAPKIEELLAQQRMDELLTAWLANLRAQSTIHIDHQDMRAATGKTAAATVPLTAGGR